MVEALTHPLLSSRTIARMNAALIPVSNAVSWITIFKLAVSELLLIFTEPLGKSQLLPTEFADQSCSKLSQDDIEGYFDEVASGEPEKRVYLSVLR